VALGWQGLLRQLEAGKPVTRVAPAADPLVSRADLIGVSVDDVGTDQRLSGLVDLIRPGATLVVTRGAGGGSALTSHRPSRSTLHAYPAIASDGVVDPTGAGDVFLAALFGSLVSGNAVLGLDSAVPGSWSARLRFAAAAGSLAVEAPGLDGVPSLEAIRRRAAEVA
jgi:sugar/nucleoside kinase (ribokinase family)